MEICGVDAMKDNFMISVVLTTYDRPIKILERSLNSVLCQTYIDYEIVVVDTSNNLSLATSKLKHVLSLDRKNI